MADNKTQPTDSSVDDYIAARARGTQAQDCAHLVTMMRRITGCEPTMWGPSMVGFGTYSYRYESGRTGTAFEVGFAIRMSELVVYLVAESPPQLALLSRLGPHRMGKACLYLKRLDGLDLAVLEELVGVSVADVRRRYPAASQG